MLLNIYCDTNSKAIYDMRLTQSVKQQTMVVKLSINSILSGDSTAEDEAVMQDNDIELCVLRYGTNGVLEITPDFTHNRRPYTVEVFQVI